MVSTNHGVGGGDFTPFVIASGTAVSSTEKKLRPNASFGSIVLSPLVAWTPASIGFEVKMSGSNDWQPVKYIGEPVRCQVDSFGDLIIAPPELVAMLLSPVNHIRLTSIDDVLFTPVNQGANRTINVYFVG